VSGPWTCGNCRQEFDEFTIVPHMKTAHPGFADDLEQWPDGAIAVGLPDDVEVFVP
jgi:hypothetical protein